MKGEKALKLAHSVYRNIDVVRENAFTYSDLIFVFFNESSSMADIEEALKKNKPSLVRGIEENLALKGILHFLIYTFLFHYTKDMKSMKSMKILLFLLFLHDLHGRKKK